MVKSGMCIVFFILPFIIGLLICTLISENQGLEKSRSISNPRKSSGLAPECFTLLIKDSMIIFLEILNF